MLLSFLGVNQKKYSDNINALIYIFILSFFFLTFIDRNLSNISLLLVLFLCLSVFHVKDLALTKPPIVFIFIFFASLFLNRLYYDTEFNEYDNYSRLIICLPIYYYFIKNPINPSFLVHLIIASSLGIIIKFILAADVSMFAGRYLGSSSSAITYANMIMTIIILLMYTIILNKTSLVYRILIASILILFLVFIWSQTLTRGSLIGLILSSILIILWNEKSRVIMFFSTSVLLFLIYLSPVGDRIDNFFVNLNNINFSTIENSTIENRSLNQRFAYSIFAIENIMKNPTMGIGASNVEQAMTDDFRNEKGILVAVADHVHNEYLDIALKFGLISLVIFIIIWISIILDFIRFKKNHLSCALVLTVISHMGYMLTQSVFAHHQATVFFIILLYVLLPNLYSINKKT